MLIRRVGVLVALSISLAACSPQEVQPDSESAPSVSSRTYVQRNTNAAPRVQSRYRSNYDEDSASQPRRQTQRARPNTHYAPVRNQAAAGRVATPTQLGSAGGDRTYRGQGALTQLPDHIAGTLRARGFSEAGMGAYVRPANGGAPILTAYADTPRNPASTMKLVTTYSALGVLGPDYRWPTELYISGPINGGTLQGDVTIKGYGNPDFRERDLRQLVQALRARGIRHIAGNFVIDTTYFNIGYSAPIDGNTGAAYNAQPEALLYNERGSCYTVRGKGNQVQRVCSSLPRSPADLNANLFGDFWRMWNGEMGGTMEGSLRVGSVPGGSQLIQTHYSNPLRDVIVEINKDSNNVMARQLLLSMGAKQFGAPGNTQKGAQAVGQFLESRGLRFGNLRIENGSGLSRIERISAREMGEMLVDAYNSPYRSDLIRSMGVIGVDGTVKNRLRNLAGRGSFKTGTLRDVRALAGYLTAANGQPYVISIIHNDGNIRGDAKQAHDQLVEWVYTGGR